VREVQAVQTAAANVGRFLSERSDLRERSERIRARCRSPGHNQMRRRSGATMEAWITGYRQ
jgi:hypothetical protein